ncbi:sensor domain-containing diguanylate cyclase [Sphingomonas prati]|uniref:diguanylate cyclase n=1 Tax=Sphingomonas prati TaxID=1843237 RepID=A0A7W9BQ11_9SPHN|nr:sensor domain-containing diguanylate cyclase [Sphingomonas prati]MBB5728008.1 diguanylate cyclase (GGDEF)-like protein/PAS domain S-box-containing protein [Sphingomonas prati]GGE82537.1 hypothetical protein GCM10011404_14030 [Sphingomonas prati]
MADGSSEEQLLEFLYACPVGLIECDTSGAIAVMNPHAMQHLMPLAGSRDVCNLFSALEQHAPELRSMVASFTARTGRICDGHRIFVELGPGRGDKVPKVLACSLVRIGPDRLIATLTDVSQQVFQERRLREVDTWFSTLLDGVNGYAPLTIAFDGAIASATPCFTRLTGYDHIDVTGHNLADILTTDAPSGELRLDEQLVIAARDGWHLQEGWQKRADGDLYWCQRLVVVSEGGGAPGGRFSVVLRDVPQRDAAATDLHRLLSCDHLTGASNRRHFGQTMAREHVHWRELRQPLSLVVLDLDHFKAVNDSYGHPIGDTLLCRITEVCTALMPPGGIFARLGGEEFGVLLPRYDHAQAVELAERLRCAIAALVVGTPHGMLQVTASFGCATMDETGSVDGLVALADERLYAAKSGGRNRVCMSSHAVAPAG